MSHQPISVYQCIYFATNSELEAIKSIMGIVGRNREKSNKPKESKKKRKETHKKWQDQGMVVMVGKI